MSKLKQKDYYKKYKRKKKRIKRQADKLWKEIVLSRHLHCESCGKPSSDPHHFFPKSTHGHLRYNLFNGVGLCSKCHFSHHHKGDPTIHYNVIQKRGDKWYQKLKYLADNRPDNYKTNLGYYEKTLKRLKKEKEAHKK